MPAEASAGAGAPKLSAGAWAGMHRAQRAVAAAALVALAGDELEAALGAAAAGALVGGAVGDMQRRGVAGKGGAGVRVAVVVNDTWWWWCGVCGAGASNGTPIGLGRQAYLRRVCRLLANRHHSLRSFLASELEVFVVAVTCSEAVS